MAWLKELLTVLRSLIITQPAPSGRPEPPQRMQRKVLMIVYNPIVRSEGGSKLNHVLGWNDPDKLAQGYADDLREVSGGLADYQVVDRLEVDGWPVKVDGFCYDADSFLRCWRAGGGWHDPDAVDYGRIASTHNLLLRVAAGEIDEVWLFGTPSAGFYESIMLGPGGFWCNSSPLPGTSAAGRRFVIMGFNYERGVGEMLEAFGPRVESTLEHAWRRLGKDPQHNLWKRFIQYDKMAPGQAHCGNVHYAPSSLIDYDWGNPRSVRSFCDDWLSFPEFPGVARVVDRAEWGSGEIRAHHRWWLGHLPGVAGETSGVSNNWWRLAVDPNTVS